MEILKASQESHQSRFSQYKAPLKCNSPHEANALVLAKWAADELNLASLPSEQTDDGDNPGGDQNARGTNKNGRCLNFGFLRIRHLKVSGQDYYSSYHQGRREVTQEIRDTYQFLGRLRLIGWHAVTFCDI